MTAAEPLEIRIDISSALPTAVTREEPLSIGALVFLPDTVADPPTVITLLSGGTYDRRYFHFEVAGRTGYSLAEYLRARGHIVVLPDHLGIGASSRATDQMLVTRHIAAAANHAAMNAIYARLSAGTLCPGFPALASMVKIGGGHSMGACQTITQQAAHRTYDLCLILGYSAYGVHLTFDGQLVPADSGPLDTTMPDYILRDRSVLRSTFHWGDVPRDVLAVDDNLLVEVPYMLGAQAASMGVVREDASRIEVPLYIVLGERDVSPDPHAEPSYYRSCGDITLHILPRSGHCHNFAETRLMMYDRIDRWVGDQAAG